MTVTKKSISKNRYYLINKEKVHCDIWGLYLIMKNQNAINKQTIEIYF